MGNYNDMIYLIYNIIILSKKEDIKDNNEVNRCSKCDKKYKIKNI